MLKSSFDIIPSIILSEELAKFVIIFKLGNGIIFSLR